MRLAKVLALACTFAMLLTIAGGAFALGRHSAAIDRPSMSAAGEQAMIVRGHLGDITPAGAEVEQFNGWAKLSPVVQENMRRNYGANPRSTDLAGNVRASDPAGGANGVTQSEVSVCADAIGHVLVAWNDGQGFTAGFTLSSYAFSCDFGATFTDGGNVPKILAADQAFGDCVLDHDKHGNFYMSAIYTTGSAQDIAVWRGTFTGSCTFVWNTPVIAAVGPSASNALDKNWMAVDKSAALGWVYVGYARFVSAFALEEVTSANGGVTWSAPTTIKLGGSPGFPSGCQFAIDEHNGTAYMMWDENGASISCFSDYGGNSLDSGMGFSKSTNHGLTWSAATTVAAATHQAAFGTGVGNIRDRLTVFPSIAIDNTNGPFKGSLYCVWAENATSDTVATAGATTAENEAGGNATPGAGGVQTIVPGGNGTGSLTLTTDTIDYWKITLTAGQHLMIALEPVNFNCGVTGASSRNFRLRLYANPANQGVSPPDTLLASSNRSGFTSIVYFDVVKSGTYTFRVQSLGTTAGTATGTYRVKSRLLTYNSPNASTPARDSRDVVEIHSRDGGATWSSKALVNDSPMNFDEELPFVTVDSCGQVLVFYFDRRETNTIGNPLNGGEAQATDIYMNKSTNGGGTWGSGVLITDQTNFFNNNTNAVPNMGDYNQACVGGNYVYAAWSDERLANAGIAAWVPGLTYNAPGTPGSGPDAYVQRITTGCTGSTAIEVAGVLIDAGRGYVNLRWSAFVTGVARFQVLRSATLNGAYEAVSGDIAGGSVGDYSFRDESVRPGAEYYYKIGYSDGVEWKFTSPSRVVTPSAVFALRAVHPNPTTGPSRIDYELARAGRASIEVYNMVGARVRTLLDASRQAGAGSAQWDGLDQSGRKLAAGAYFVRLTSAGQSLTQRVLLLH